MNMAAHLADVLAHVLDERDHVMLANGLDGGDSLNVEGRLLLDLREVVDRHLVEPHPRLDGENLDLEPARELRTLGEDAGHLLSAVAGDH